ncbi:MAG TPA: BON domain-containing protein, partial [Actinomycetes bacterium]
MTVDADVLERIRERLRVSTRVGDDRIQVAARDDDVVLLGAVATPEEATVAAQLAEEYASAVVNELQVDQGLREGLERPVESEPAAPADDEVLVGSTDMLAGPDTVPTGDMAEALDENEPWEPPDVPQLAPTRVEERGGVSPEDREALSTWEERGGDLDDLLDEEDRTGRERPSAPDLSAADLRRAGEGRPLPSLDPTAASPTAEPDFDPTATAARPAGDDMVEQVPGTPKGPGAVGEPTTGGGALGGTPAVETGAIGADTAPSDPARDASGGVQKIAGTDRGPAAPEDR